MLVLSPDWQKVAEVGRDLELVPAHLKHQAARHSTSSGRAMMLVGCRCAASCREWVLSRDTLQTSVYCVLSRGLEVQIYCWQQNQKDNEARAGELYKQKVSRLHDK